VTLVNKENIHKAWGRVYHDAFNAIAADFPDIKADYALVDAVGMRLVANPRDCQVIVTENMFGDILSDVGAGLIGGLGVAPGANYGDHIALFEAVHGSAPDIAGKDIANPTAMMLSAALLLEHIGEDVAADALRAAIRAVYRIGKTITADLSRRYLDEERHYEENDPVGTKEFTDAVIAQFDNL
jgi:isocitrate dehydrogenase (NAD+)